MEIQDKVVLVTGANRGLGRAFCSGFIEAGARKIYATSRSQDDYYTDPTKILYYQLDVTNRQQIDLAATELVDVEIVVNNAGVLHNSPILGRGAETSARNEMETNFFGALAMARAFAPILKRNDGGAIVNILSVASWFGNPFMATYCASKAAALMMTNALRIELLDQNTQVLGVFAGYIDTDMAAGVSALKTPPRQIVDCTIRGLRDRVDNVLADARAVDVESMMRRNPRQIYADIEARWRMSSSIDDGD